jgi:uncharacterized membrane protein
MPSQAQSRASAIIGFREELARLTAEGVAVDPTAIAAIRAHHDALLADFARQADVDLTATAAQLSLGMRIATVLGAAALSAAYGFFVASVWGDLTIAPQLLLVTFPPIILAFLTDYASRREASGYIASIMATVAMIAFWVDLIAVGSLFNLPDSRSLLFAIGAFAFALAYLYRLGIPLLVGILTIGGWLWSLAAIPRGLWWRDGIDSMEPMLVLGVACMVMPRLLPRPAGFIPIWRVTGVLAVSIALLTLGQNVLTSAFHGVNPNILEGIYQLACAIVFPWLVVIGVRREWREITLIGTSSLSLFLLLRLHDWFWDYLPKWLFFLLVGFLALLVLLLLRQLRSRKGLPT